MKTIVGLGALLTGMLLVAGNAQAGLLDCFCRCPCPPQPACAPAATASVERTSSYTATYQPGATGQAERAPARWKSRADEVLEMQRKIKGR